MDPTTNCGQCYRCLDGYDANGYPIRMMRLIVCSICGNKRCPHATDHELDCTNSNDPDSRDLDTSRGKTVRLGVARCARRPDVSRAAHSRPRGQRANVRQRVTGDGRQVNRVGRHRLNALWRR